MLEVKKINEGLYYFETVDEKFKFNVISINFILPLNEINAAKNTLISSLLRQSCRKYPNSLKLGNRLRSLYGANLFSDVKKAGDKQIIIFGIKFLDDEFTIDKENITKEVIELFREIIFNPKIENGGFIEKEVETEKRDLVNVIMNEYGDKRQFALKQAIKTLFKDQSLAVDKFGSKKAVEMIQAKELLNSYHELLNRSKVFVCSVSRRSMFSSLTPLLDEFSSLNRGDIYKFNKEKYFFSSKKEKEEVDDLTQAKMVIAFAQKKTQEEIDLPMVVMNCLFGGSATSMLFNNVREKMSLCYYCKSSFDPYSGVIFVESAVDGGRVNKAYDEILNQMEMIQLGKFSDYELKQAKDTLIGVCCKVLDDEEKITNYVLNCFLRKRFFSLKEMVSKIDKVTKKEVENAAKNFTVGLKYTLKEKMKM